MLKNVRVFYNTYIFLRSPTPIKSNTMYSIESEVVYNCPTIKSFNRRSFFLRQYEAMHVWISWEQPIKYWKRFFSFLYPKPAFTAARMYSFGFSMVYSACAPLAQLSLAISDEVCTYLFVKIFNISDLPFLTFSTNMPAFGIMAIKVLESNLRKTPRCIKNVKRESASFITSWVWSTEGLRCPTHESDLSSLGSSCTCRTSPGNKRRFFGLSAELKEGVWGERPCYGKAMMSPSLPSVLLGAEWFVLM